MSSDRYEEISSIMVAALKHRELKPGSTGWTVDDLDEPAIARQWQESRFELVHGVIAEMAAAYFDHSRTVDKLFDVLKAHFWAKGIRPEFGTEVDMVLGDTVRYRADGIMLLPADMENQKKIQRERGEDDQYIYTIRSTPTLVVECMSKGHEPQDLIVKHRDYAAFGVPNYWILNPYRKTLDIHRLAGNEYVLDAAGTSPDTVQPTVFDGLIIPLNKVFR